MVVLQCIYAVGTYFTFHVVSDRQVFLWIKLFGWFIVQVQVKMCRRMHVYSLIPRSCFHITSAGGGRFHCAHLQRTVHVTIINIYIVLLAVVLRGKTL